MRALLTTALALHVLASIFWAGSTFTLARTGGRGAELLFGPQMGAFAVALLTGMYLWRALHEGSFGLAEKLLMAGALCALAAAAVQASLVGPVIRQLCRAPADVLRARAALASRIAAALLAIAAVCMASARYGF